MDGFRTSASYGDRARLTALLKLLDEGAPVGVVAVSAERIHLYEWKLGSLELVHDWEAEMYSLDWRERKAGKPSDVARTQGTASSGRDQYDQRLEHNRARFLEETGRLTAGEARSRGWRRVIGFGDPEHVREFDEGAEKGTEVELADAVDVIPEDRGKLLERVNAAVADGNRRRELDLIERAVEGSRTPGGHGALGLIDVQGSLNEGRVDHLIFDADTENPGARRRRGRGGREGAPDERQGHAGRGRCGGESPRARGRRRNPPLLSPWSTKVGPGPAVDRRVLHDRLLEQGLPGEVGDAGRGEAEVLHAGLGRAGDAELVLHPECEDRDRVLLGRDLRIASPRPPATRCSSAVTARPVLASEVSTLSESSGLMIETLTTSASTPSSRASVSAASSAAPDHVAAGEDRDVLALAQHVDAARPACPGSRRRRTASSAGRSACTSGPSKRS